MNNRDAIQKAFLAFNNQNPNEILFAQDYFESGWQAALASQAQHSQWISVEERLPEDTSTVLVVNQFGQMYTCRKSVILAKNSRVQDPNFQHEVFTHWMPLPLPPAPEVCSDGGKCGAGGYCITCPNVPAPDGDKA